MHVANAARCTRASIKPDSPRGFYVVSLLCLCRHWLDRFAPDRARFGGLIMRRVLPRNNVAHLWAHGIQDDARDKGGSFYFTGPTLYSYGTHFAIGHILRGAEYGALAGRVLWNDASYSNTTSKHKTIAWRALTREQTDKRLHVPALTSDTARAIDRAIREKRLPDYAGELLRRVQSDVASIIGKRHGSGPFCAALFDARKYDATARALYDAAGKTYPLEAIPQNDAIPADKAGRAAFVARFSRAIVADDYRIALQRAADCLATARAETTSATGTAYVETWRRRQVAQSTYDIAQRGLRECDTADKHYSTLHAGKKSPQAGKVRKALQPLAEQFKRARDAADAAETMERLQHFARVFYRAMHDGHKARMGHTPVFRLRNLPGYISQTRTAAQSIGIDPDSFIGRAVARASRIDDAAVILKAVDNAKSAFKTAESYGQQWPSDARRNYAECINYARQIRMREASSPRFVAYALRQLGDIETRAAECARAMLEAEKAKRAADIAAWIAGTSNKGIPYDAGTYARIRGDVVETSRGASVPIAHACRLARVFDRIVSAGGKDWPDGSGPMVGHYRVNHIGADGSLTIGCHQFDPAEARRLRDVLAQCDACQGAEPASA